MLGLTGWKKYLGIYLILLVASHLTISVFGGAMEQQKESGKSVSLQVVTADSSHSDDFFDLFYEDQYKGNDEDPPVLILLPGGPEGPEVFDSLAADLSSRFRVITPHLTRGNDNKNALPDYSFRTRAEYAHQLQKKLGFKNVHVIGYGLGGASAINLAHSYPSDIESLSLISSIGVQELELLGSYRLNHAVHGVQLAAVWLLQNAVPHFGLLDRAGFNVSYAKSHYESDQRPIRSYLKQYQKPLFILHGRDDPFVPLAAAQEHHRIVPQSSIQLFDAGHDLIKTHSDSVSQSLVQFILDVENDKAQTADDASAQRVEQAQESFSNVDFQKFKGASLVIIMLIIIFSTLISEDLTCIGAGLLAARGLIGFWPATIACFIGIVVGDVGLYLAGRFLGRPATKKAPFKWFISDKDLIQSAEWFESKGGAIIIATRFLPGSRLPTYFSAGVIGAGFWMFISYFLLAAAIWTPMLVGISELLGNKLLGYFSLYKDYALWVVLGALVLLVVVIKVVVPVFTHKGRRILLSRYRRLTRWEYWPPYVLYAPVFCYILFLGIKYRCMTLFTAANPAIPEGGFVGESKTAILDSFNQQDVAPYARISAAWDKQDKYEHVQQFMQQHQLDYPIVLKPDVGQRGTGVQVIRHEEKLHKYLEESEKDIMVQEYCGGREFGIFYYRYPDEATGNIFSITQKHLLSVIGDGNKTVEELILDDDQAVDLAKYHLRANRYQLYDIPEDGEEIPIVELGTHARGAVFSDGRSLITDALVEEMNRICEGASGFYFGRFDVKAPSAAELKKGENITIIEANGVTSESTNIYDSDFSFWDAQKTLMSQWKLAFDIGKQNRSQGAVATSLGQLLQRLGSYIIK